MDKDSRARWLRDCEQCQGDTKKVLKILRGGVQLARKENLTLIQKVQLLLYKGLNNYYNRILHGIEIPLCTEIGAGLRLVHMNGIVINKDALIGENCTIFQQVTIGAVQGKAGAQIIGDNVYIGAGAKILGNIKVGNNVKIGANTVVTKDVPDGVTVVGINQIL